MKEVKMFKAEDGTLFESFQECLVYENEQDAKDRLITLFEVTFDYHRHDAVEIVDEIMRERSRISKILNSIGMTPSKPHPSSFTDPRDGQTYHTVELNGLRWMAQNLNYDVGEGCWFFENDAKNGEKYGRLYTWEAAKKACPPGWRLPTDEEWKRLVNAQGGYYDHESSKDVGDPKKAYTALLENGSSGFAALLGGLRTPSGSFYILGDYGFYWSATEYAPGGVWAYYFDRGTGKLIRYNTYKALGFSCRCVQD